MKVREEKPPIAGAVRVIRRFLFIPKQLGHKKKWFKMVFIKQQYRPNKYKRGATTFKWRDVSFLR